MVMAKLLHEELHDNNVGSTFEPTLKVDMKSKLSHIFIFIIMKVLYMITRRMPNVDIVVRKVIIRKSVEPKKRT